MEGILCIPDSAFNVVTTGPFFLCSVYGHNFDLMNHIFLQQHNNFQQLENDIGAPKDVLLFQSACANCLDRNWTDACENVIGIFSITTVGIEAKTEAVS